MWDTPKHKVFVSFHHDDQEYKDEFVYMMEDDIVDISVEDGDIDETLRTTTIYRIIRDEYISEATVTVVLIGPCTWKRKYIDWEIGSSLRDTMHNSRCGLLGVLLPNHPDYRKPTCNAYKVPPRFADNLDRNYALLHRWSSNPTKIRNYVHKAYLKRYRISPDNGRDRFMRNKSGTCSSGWRDYF